MRTLRLTIAYDGTRYAGWQIQQRRTRTLRGDMLHATSNTSNTLGTTCHVSLVTCHKKKRPTIQGVLEHTLYRILREPVRVVGSGRTDAGVHSIAQVAHIRIRHPIACERLLRSLNQLLPTDVAVTAIEPVPATFHARFGTTTKRYHYRIFIGAVVPPFIRPYVYHFSKPLHLARMRREAKAFVSRHDFRAFARASSLVGRRSIRTITDIQIKRHKEEITIEVEGNGFLHTMVRRMVGALLDVGRGYLPEGSIHRMLREPNRHPSATTAPAQGLSLVSVSYGARPDSSSS